MLQITTKTSPQGVAIEYVEPTSGVQTNLFDLDRFRKGLALDRAKRNREELLPRPITKQESWTHE